jgi:hypothetical protein
MLYGCMQGTSGRGKGGLLASFCRANPPVAFVTRKRLCPVTGDGPTPGTIAQSGSSHHQMSGGLLTSQPPPGKGLSDRGWQTGDERPSVTSVWWLCSFQPGLGTALPRLLPT